MGWFRNRMDFSRLIVMIFMVIVMNGLCRAQENECLAAILEKLTSGNQADLMAMIVGTGKGLNDLGEYDLCINNPDTTYATVSAFPLPAYVGVCLPSACNSKHTEIVEAAITQMVQQQGMKAEGKVDFPDSEPPKVTAGNWIGFFGFGFLILLCLVGIGVEYSNLFGKVQYEGIEESKHDKALVDSK